MDLMNFIMHGDANPPPQTMHNHTHGPNGCLVALVVIIGGLLFGAYLIIAAAQKLMSY